MDVLGTYKDEPVILQSKPQRRTISCSYGYNVEDTYFLKFPYIVFCKYPFDTICLPNHYLRVGFSPEPISSLDARIYLPPLPNIQNCGVTFPICGCSGVGDGIKTSVEKFWQKSFKTGELLCGEMSLCRMFGMLYHESNVHIALKYWENLNLVLFNERMCRTSFSLSVGEFLEISSHNFPLKLMF
jgi:hypothetical protein